MPRIVMTGATGFLGGQLFVAMQDRGWSVANMGRRNSESLCQATNFVVDGSWRSMARVLESWRPDVVVHLASHFASSHEPDELDQLIQANVCFSTHLLEAMRQSGVGRIVSAATSWQHFGGAQYSPVNLYAATKQAFEAICGSYVETHQFSALHLRLSDTTGIGDTRPKLFTALNDARIAGRVLEMSPGGQRIDLLDVSDVVHGFIVATESLLAGGSGQVAFALRHAEQWTLKEIVECYRHVAGGPIVRFGGRPYRPREVMVPSPYPDTLPGWRPKVPVNVAVEQVARAHLAQWRP